MKSTTSQRSGADSRQDLDELGYIKSALNQLDDGFTVYNLDLKLVAWNDRFFDCFELPREEFAHVGKPFADFIRYNAERGEYGPGDPDEQVAERVALARTFTSHCMERTRPDGTILEIRGNPIPDIGFVTVYKDITARRRAEAALAASHEQLEHRVLERTRELTALNEKLKGEISERKRALTALRESEEWIRLIADAVPVLIGYVDADQRYRFANRQFEEWLGHPPERIIGAKVEEILGRDIYRELLEQMKTALSGQPVSNEFQLQLPNGRQIEAASTFIPHFGQQGDVLGYFILAQDVTEHRQAEGALRHAQKMQAVGQLTGGLAHDFNNLLTIIIGNLNLLREQLDDEFTRSQIEPALDAARRGAELVKHLLAFSRKQPLKPKLIDVRALVSGMTELLCRTLGTQMTIAMRLPDSPCTILADPNQMENAILNLSINARDAMADEDSGTLTIEVSDSDDEHRPDGPVRITVSDTGAGMTREVAERAFEPFFSTKGIGRGHGMGLSMVYGFIQQSGGTISIQSRPGRGTVIEMRLPQPDRAATGTDNKRRLEPETPVGSERILVVEDDRHVRSYAVAALRDLEYQVIEADDGNEALEILQNDTHVNLVLSDVIMPIGPNGFDLADFAKRLRPDIRIVLMSGYPGKEIKTSEFDVMGFRFLPKPFEKHELAQTIRESLDQ